MKTIGSVIADEVWYMIPDKAKEIMKEVKVSFMESVAADVDKFVKDAESDVLGKAWMQGALSDDWYNKWIDEVYATNPPEGTKKEIK